MSKESFSDGAWTQMVAKGPMDSYLTTGTHKYWNPYYYPGYIVRPKRSYRFRPYWRRYYPYALTYY